MTPPGTGPLFDPPLAPDPVVALPAPQVMPFDKPGPLHRVQFTIEFVGPRSVPAAHAAHLLTPDWFHALGEPYAFVMRPADTAWRPLDGSPDGSYDSLALAWDYLSPRGALSTASARHLLSTAERFGQGIARRAMALPPPEDVDRLVASLLEIHENLDVGVGLSVHPLTGRVSERELWIACARLGLVLTPSGSYDWVAPGHPSPLLSVTPVGTTEAFSPEGVQRGETHEGVSLGFNVPRCPSPTQGLEGLFRVADTLAASTHGQIYDDSGNPFGPRSKEEMRQGVVQASTLLEEVGLRAGSPEALRVFPLPKGS